MVWVLLDILQWMLYLTHSQSTSAAEATGPGKPSPVHILALVGRGYLRPTHFEPHLNITCYVSAVGLAITTSTDIENGTIVTGRRYLTAYASEAGGGQYVNTIKRN